MKEARRKGKAGVVGGSIAGISCAHVLIAAGWDVVVLEKTCSPPNGCATGAGLGLDTVSLKLIEPWVKQSKLLQLITPISPHGARSTNMSILDAAVLGKCLEKWGIENLSSALKEYQSIRMPVATEQVLFSQRMGCIKQHLPLSDGGLFDPLTASQEESKVLHPDQN